MQTVYSNTISNSVKSVDKKIMSLGKNLLYYSRFGLGDKNIDTELYKQLSILKEALCMPTCVNPNMIMEIISKKLK